MKNKTVMAVVTGLVTLAAWTYFVKPQLDDIM